MEEGVGLAGSEWLCGVNIVYSLLYILLIMSDIVSAQ